MLLIEIGDDDLYAKPQAKLSGFTRPEFPAQTKLVHLCADGAMNKVEMIQSYIEDPPRDSGPPPDVETYTDSLLIMRCMQNRNVVFWLTWAVDASPPAP